MLIMSAGYWEELWHSDVWYWFAQGKRWMNLSWFYKQSDTSLMRKDPDTGKFTLPMQLDSRMLFKADGADTQMYSTDLPVETIVRHATLPPSAGTYRCKMQSLGLKHAM